MRSVLFKKLAQGGITSPSMTPGTPTPNQVVPPVPMPTPEQATPPNPDAGAAAQKSVQPVLPSAGALPKTANQHDGMSTMNTSKRPLLQDLVKEAQAGAMKRARIAKEAAMRMKQAADSDSEEDKDKKKEKECDACGPGGKMASAVSTETAEKLAAAVEYILKTGAPNMPPPHLTEMVQEPGKGPGAIGVTESNVPGTSLDAGQSGQATGANLPPKNPPVEKTEPAGPATAMQDTMNQPPGGTGTQTTAMPAGQGKTAALANKNSLLLRQKLGFALTEKGHESDARLLRMAEQQAVDRMRALQQEGVMGANDPETGGTRAGSLRKALSSPIMAHEDPRHLAYAAKMHEAGSNAWNPFGGMLTPHPAEQGGTALQYGMMGAKEGSAKIAALADALHRHVKQAEDAINPAHISAGPAVPPNATQAEEGVPPKPSGSQMVDSNSGAINYTKGQAKAEPKRDMSAYVSEPALSSAHDHTLQQSWDATGQAGVKVSSANEAAMRVSAARELLSRIARATTGT